MITAMKRYRFYLDESGDHTTNDLDDPDRRYLGLTGVIVEMSYYREQFHPALEGLKQAVFPHSPDDPCVLVRSRIIDRKGIFGRLNDPKINAAWETGILDFLGTHLTRIFTVVIDKKAHYDRYGAAAYHPYHYCLTLLLERYIGWLKVVGGRGDVLAESRGGTEDTKLKQVYHDIWKNGTRYLPGQEFQNVLTSKELKVKKKDQNIAGLQIADLVAYPSKIDVLTRNGRILPRTPGPFTSKMNEVLKPKYNEYGRKFLD
jgi:hypothetical protein